MYTHEWLKTFPKDLADSIIEMALERTKIGRGKLDRLSQQEKQSLAAAVERLVRADDVSDKPCGD